VFDICTQDVITLDTEVPDTLPLYQLTTPAGILEVKSIYSHLYPKCPVTCTLTNPSRVPIADPSVFGGQFTPAPVPTLVVQTNNIALSGTSQDLMIVC